VSSLLTAAIVFVCVFAASSLGQWLSPRLPEHHRTSESHDAIKLTTGMISVLAALVLGLLTASVKNAFDATDSQIRQCASTLMLGWAATLLIPISAGCRRRRATARQRAGIVRLQSRR
jgi:Na+/pantothenate symporter